MWIKQKFGVRFFLSEQILLDKFPKFRDSKNNVKNMKIIGKIRKIPFFKNLFIFSKIIVSLLDK